MYDPSLHISQKTLPTLMGSLRSGALDLASHSPHEDGKGKISKEWVIFAVFYSGSVEV